MKRCKITEIRTESVSQCGNAWRLIVVIDGKEERVLFYGEDGVKGLILSLFEFAKHLIVYYMTEEGVQSG